MEILESLQQSSSLDILVRNLLTHLLLLLQMQFFISTDAILEVESHFPCSKSKSFFVEGSRSCSLLVGIGKMMTPFQPIGRLLCGKTNLKFASRLRIKDWAFISVDSCGQSFFGYSSQEIKKASYFDFIHPTDVDRVKQSYKEEAKEGSTCFYRFRIKKQQWIWLKTDFHTIHDNNVPQYACSNHVASYEEIIEYRRKQISEALNARKKNE